MDSDDPRVVVARFWAAMQDNDWAAASERLAEDVVIEWPQSGEVFRGREPFVAINAKYPAAGRWRFTIERVVHEGDTVVTDVAFTDGKAKARVVSFATVADGCVTKLVEYWPDPFEAPAWRAPWAERAGRTRTKPPVVEAPARVEYGADMTTKAHPAGGVHTLRCDGGSRGNPGPAAYGFVLTDASGREVAAVGEYIGTATNNVAEYRALIAGLEAAVARGVSALSVVMDSELVIRQMTGQYKVKHEGLKPLHRQAREVAARLPKVTYSSVRRDDNGRADGLVNEALDQALS